MSVETSSTADRPVAMLL